MLLLSDGHPTPPQRSWALVLQCSLYQNPGGSGSSPRMHPEVLESWKHRVVLVGRDLKDPLGLISLPWVGLKANVSEARKSGSPLGSKGVERRNHSGKNRYLCFMSASALPHCLIPLSHPEVTTNKTLQFMQIYSLEIKRTFI